MNPILSFDSVRAYYGDALIVDGVSFAINEGECLALLGPNGVGKTSTVNAVYGIARVRSGRICVDGEPMRTRTAHAAARRGIALVPQGRWILPTLSIEENLILGAAARRSGPWDLDAVYELFPYLRERRRSPGYALSGGQQQMLAIARALMANPRVMLLDEPTEGLAPVVIDQLGNTLRQIRTTGTAMLLIEQRLDLVMRLADRYAVMSKGRIGRTGLIASTDLEELGLAVTLSAPESNHV